MNIQTKDMLLKAQQVLERPDYIRFSNFLYKRNRKAVHRLLNNHIEKFRTNISEGVNVSKELTKLEICKIMFRKVDEFIDKPRPIV